MAGHIADIDELQSGFTPGVPGSFQRANWRWRYSELIGGVVTADMPRHFRPQLRDDARGDAAQHVWRIVYRRHDQRRDLDVDAARAGQAAGRPDVLDVDAFAILPHSGRVTFDVD